MGSKICSVEGCNNKYCAKGLCSKHYMQIRVYGEILERTMYEKNEIIKYDDYAEIVLYNKQHKEVGRTAIDLKITDKVATYKWYVSNGYVRNNTVGFLHRFIVDCPDDMVVDHIDGNPFNNRECNLRICTQADNMKNQKKQKGDNSSQYKGVSYCKDRDKWVVRICINNKDKHIGYFDSELEASIEADKAYITYYGIYAKLNHPIDNYYNYIIDLGLNPDNFIR